jgi:hypothetical protein
VSDPRVRWFSGSPQPNSGFTVGLCDGERLPTRGQILIELWRIAPVSLRQLPCHQTFLSVPQVMPTLFTTSGTSRRSARKSRPAACDRGWGGGNGRRRPKPPLHPCRTRPSRTTPSLGAPSLARRPALPCRAKRLIWRPRTSRNGAASRAVLSALRRSPESSGHPSR